MSSEQETYKTIFKSTFLFGFVQVFNILVKVGLNKAVAVFLGPGGMGVISLYQSTINILKTGFELGISQSAVRDISQGVAQSPEAGVQTISITKKIFLLTALAGGVTTLILSPLLSRWTFGSEAYTYPFMWLSLVVSLTIISEGQLGILKGMRWLKPLAKASLWGSVVGLITGVPLYFFFGENGIVPSLITTALTAVVFSAYYVRRIELNCPQPTFGQAISRGKKMIQMGVALMYVNFLVVVSDYIVRIYIERVADLHMVGLFQAGTMIVTSYFGVILTALSTDYYPRISALGHDNVQINVEFNKQCEVGLIIIAPLLVIFMFAQQFFIDFLYTRDFLPVIEFLKYATFGIFLTLCSNSLGIILLAKQEAKVFFVTATIGRIVIITTSILAFRYWGLPGLGIATALTGLFHLVFMQTVLWWKHKIRMHKNLFVLLAVCLLLTAIAYSLNGLESEWLRYTLGAMLTAISIGYSVWQIKRIMGINLIEIISTKIKR